jgi:molybdopterin-guanine dinucleotide biosynthesis protein A
MTYDGVVLAGGAARRFGGINKPEAAFGGRRLLDISIAALASAEHTVVVGAPLPTERTVTWAREDPIGGGPVAALAAALATIEETKVVVLAADLPFVTIDVVQELVSACDGVAAALAIDKHGRDQPLLACYDAAQLRESLPHAPHGASMRSIIRELEWMGPVPRLTLTASPHATYDCDTPADLSAAQELA